MVLPVLFFTELFTDFNIVLKIFVLLTIAQFLLMHLGKKPLTYVLLVVLAWFVIFDQWSFFGGIYLFWMLFILGISGLVIDWFFTTQNLGGGDNAPIDNGHSLMARQHAISAMQARMGGRGGHGGGR